VHVLSERTIYQDVVIAKAAFVVLYDVFLVEKALDYPREIGDLSIE